MLPVSDTVNEDTVGEKSFSYSDLQEYIGKTGLLLVPPYDRQQGNFYIPVEVVDSKSAYGHIRVLVRPIGGIGEQWVSISRVDFKLKPKK